MKWNLIATYNYSTDIEYIMFKNLLNANEIPFFAKDSHMVFLESCLSAAIGGIKIYVPEAFLAKALELLESTVLGYEVVED